MMTARLQRRTGRTADVVVERDRTRVRIPIVFRDSGRSEPLPGAGSGEEEISRF